MTAPEGEPKEEEGGSEQGTITHQQMNKLLAKQKSDLQKQFGGPEFDAIKAKAAQFDDLTRSTEETLEQYKARTEEQAAELAWRDVLLRRQEIAATKGLDPKLWSRVQGETPEEIDSDISDLLSTFTTRKSSAPLRSGASADGQLTAKERAAQALRSTRQ